MPQCHGRAVRRYVHLRRFVVPALAAAVIVGGCGSDEPAVTSTSEIEVVSLGDSITSGSPGYDPDPEARAALGFGDDPRSQYEYWAEKADPRLTFRNCGIFGERTDEIARRLDACVDGDSDVLIVQGGINDIAQGRPVEAAADDLLSIVERGSEAGLDVAITDVLPWNNGHPAADEPIAELNRLIAAIAREQGVPLIGFHDELEDPDARGLMAAGLTADGDHPSVNGYRRLGELVAGELEPLTG